VGSGSGAGSGAGSGSGSDAGAGVWVTCERWSDGAGVGAVVARARARALLADHVPADPRLAHKRGERLREAATIGVDVHHEHPHSTPSIPRPPEKMMTAFRCRFLKPVPSDPRRFPERTLERDDPGAAAQDFHFEGDDFGYCFSHEYEPGSFQRLRFALVEVEHPDSKKECFVSKTIHNGIWRAGGIKALGTIRTLEDIAQALDWKHDPKELLDAWDGEESYEDARARRQRKLRS